MNREAVVHSVGYSANTGPAHAPYDHTKLKGPKNLKHQPSKPLINNHQHRNHYSKNTTKNLTLNAEIISNSNGHSAHSQHPQLMRTTTSSPHTAMRDEPDALSVSSLSLTPSPSPQAYHTNYHNIYKRHTYKYDNKYNKKGLIPLYLIYGFIRGIYANNDTIFYYQPITQLILLYFDDNKFDESVSFGGKQHGSFVWKLATLHLITATQIDSIPFQIGSFLWHLSIFPYGIDEEHINFTNLYINLSANIFFSIYELVINARLYCIETKSCWSSIKTFKTAHDYHGWQKGALKITEVTRFKYLTFIVYINILKIRSRKALLYQYPLCISSVNKFTIKWKIDKLLMMDLKRANEMKRFESDIVHNMWVLGCVPNGIKKDNESCVFKIYLKLCALPPNITKIKVKFNILCIETKKHLKYIYNDFDYKHKYWQTDKLCKRSYLIFNDYNMLRFKAEIEIIEQYDNNYNELSSNKWRLNLVNNTINTLINTYILPSDINKLINGFARAFFASTGSANHAIDYSILLLINKYYPSIAGDLFTWHISCEQIIKLSTLNYKQRFDSKIFTISNLKWFLQIYPNGYRAEDEGFCSVYLILAYLPSMLKEITIHFGVYCPQTMSNFSTIHTFNHSRDGRGTRRMLSLHHLKRDISSQSKIITFNCYVNILRIKIKEKEIIYQYPLVLTQWNYKKYISTNFKWIIDKEMMIKFKQCNNGQRFESKIFNQMWNLSIFPNENKSKNKSRYKQNAYNEEQNVVIGIRLCSLPKDILKIKVKYKLLCVEFKSDNLNTTFEWSHCAIFDYENYYVKFPKHTIKSYDINRYNELTFNAQIQILELYDVNGKVAPNNIMNKQI